VENEAWNGTMAKIVKIVDFATHDDIANEQNMGHVVVPSTVRTAP